MEKYLMGIDAGNTSSKVVIFDLYGKMIATASVASLRRQSWDCRQDSVSRILTALRVCFHTHCSESAGSRVLNSVSDSGLPTDGLRSLTIDCAW